jgi:hypothetical protein
MVIPLHTTASAKLANLQILRFVFLHFIDPSSSAIDEAFPPMR